MRLLFVLPSLPYPPDDGGKMKVLNVLRYLSPRHDCDVVCLGKYDEFLIDKFRSHLPKIGSVKIFKESKKWTQFLLAIVGFLQLKPFSFARFSSQQLREWVREAQRKKCYEVIHYDIVNMAQYHDVKEGCASVHSPNDATSQVYFRVASCTRGWRSRLRLILSAHLLRRFEKKSYANFSIIHVVSEDDKTYLNNIVPTADIHVIPISSGYRYSLCNSTPIRPLSTTYLITVCGNLGDISIANGFHQFLDEVMPRLLFDFPMLRVRVLGKIVPPFLLEKIKTCPNIEFQSWVEDFESFLRQSDLVIIPDLAGAPGAKTRVVQAMALGLTVVGSRNGLEGIPLISGVHGMIYKSSFECIQIITELLSDPLKRQILGNEAARLAAANYSLDVVGPKFEALYGQAIERARATKLKPIEVKQLE